MFQMASDIPDIEEQYLGGSDSSYQATPWTLCEGRTYECKALFCPEEGGYTVYAIRLPGCVTQGDTLEEAIENIKDAFRECILSYSEDGKPIPWSSPEEFERPSGSFEQWIDVYV